MLEDKFCLPMNVEFIGVAICGTLQGARFFSRGVFYRAANLICVRTTYLCLLFVCFVVLLVSNSSGIFQLLNISYIIERGGT